MYDGWYVLCSHFKFLIVPLDVNFDGASVKLLRALLLAVIHPSLSSV
jgi:hypothetical protein